MFDDLSGLRILVVEDDPALLEVTTLLLQDCGADVHTAPDGLEAWLVLRHQKVDLVLSDIQMPNLDGLQLLAAIRKDDPSLPVVLLVTGQSQIDEAESRRLGAAGLLYKPVQMAELAGRIRHLCAKV